MSIEPVVDAITKNAVFRQLSSSIQGLSESEAAIRQQIYGPNRLVFRHRWKFLQRLAKHFLNLFSLLLDVAAVTCFVANAMEPGEGMFLLGWALFGVSMMNSLFALAQESRVDRAMEELKKFLPPTVRLRREGRESIRLADELVPGDVILLAEGDRIPADARLVESEDLLVNNATLTGESRSQALSAAPLSKSGSNDPIDASETKRSNSHVVFAGCSVVRGHAVAVVLTTGRQTEFGKIATLSHAVRRPPSTIEREIDRMVRVLTLVAVVMGSLFFVAGVASGRSLWVNVVFMLGIIVANVPEGLLPTFTLALSMASLRMAKKQVLVKNLEVIETLGCVHVICTDKTGTLTKNEVAVGTIVDSQDGKPISDRIQLQALLRVALVSSEVRWTSGPVEPTREQDQENSAPRRNEDSSRTSWSGDPLDVAIVKYYASQFEDPSAIVTETKRHFPFDLQKRREAGILATAGETLFAVKGAWESLRPLVCSHQTPRHNEVIPANEESLVACDQIVRRISQSGLRVIAVAHRHLSKIPPSGSNSDRLERSLILDGFIGLEDPLRDEVPEAVARCQGAGIRVLLITGDHPDTAEAVARQCGILPPAVADELATQQNQHEQPILLGNDLQTLDESQIGARVAQGVVVFARSTPEQKMKIVTSLQRLGHVVAMTGDGVNDAPALKRADVGIAMGMTGTDVAREAADLILLDDNFVSIVRGVEEGRAVFANMQKFTSYVLASNIPEIVPFLLFIVFPVPLALTVIQILSIDMGTDLLPAIGLGNEEPEADVMRRPPRHPRQRLLSFRLMSVAYLFLGCIEAAWAMFLFFLVLAQGGWKWGTSLATDDPLYRSATGITLATVILMQIANVIGRRSHYRHGLDRSLLRNSLLVCGIAIEVLFSWAILYVAPVQRILQTGPVRFQIYALAWLGIPILFSLDLMRKIIVRKPLSLVAPRRMRTSRHRE